MKGKIRLALKSSTIHRSLELLSVKDRRKLALLSFFQVCCSLLDLLGVGLAGALGALAIRGVQAQAPGDRVTSLLEMLNLDELSFQRQVMSLALLTTVILMSRTIITVILSRKIIFFLSARAASLSTELNARYFAQDFTEIEKTTSQRMLFAVTSGTEIVMIRVLGSAANMSTDMASLILISGGLAIVSPTMFLISTLLFGATGVLMHYFLNIRAKVLGELHTDLHIESNSLVLNAYSSFRESFVKRTLPARVLRIQEVRQKLSSVVAEVAFLPNISKYVFEIVLLVGILVVAASQFFISDASRAVGSISIFLAAGMRIAPAAMRLQQSFITIKSSVGEAESTFEFTQHLTSRYKLDLHEVMLNTTHEGFKAEIVVSNAIFKYENTTSMAIDISKLVITEGSTVALVGKSGSGKTTLIDLILGIRTLDAGMISISGMAPHQAIERFPGAIGYVPQETIVFGGTLIENLVGDYSTESVGPEDIEYAIQTARLNRFEGALELYKGRFIGDGGQGISGGQRQRIGIAKAMLSRPKLIILDEATSSLDGKTEFEISSAIDNLGKDVTVLIVAHRLATIQKVDRVFYLDGGKIIAEGTFDEVRTQVPDFDEQAKLMGL